MQEIINKLIEKYSPEGIIVYGSYADGTNGEASDFDALVIGSQNTHLDVPADGVLLDVFMYPKEYLDELTDLSEIVQIYHGVAAYDPNGTAAELIAKVRDYVDNLPKANEAEKEGLRTWCKKMLSRANRGDAEGMFRRHWLMSDSLDIYCRLRGIYYFGPKKTIARIKRDDPEGYALLENALSNIAELGAWILHILGE